MLWPGRTNYRIAEKCNMLCNVVESHRCCVDQKWLSACPSRAREIACRCQDQSDHQVWSIQEHHEAKAQKHLPVFLWPEDVRTIHCLQEPIPIPTRWAHQWHILHYPGTGQAHQRNLEVELVFKSIAGAVVCRWHGQSGKSSRLPKQHKQVEVVASAETE